MSNKLTPKKKEIYIIYPQAQISWLNSGEPFSEQFQDFYFSTDGGYQETEYVFLKPNQFPERFYLQHNSSSAATISIGETGFGTGLNFLVTLYYWLQIPTAKHTVHFISTEKYPFTKIQLQKVYQTFSSHWPQLTELCELLLSFYPDVFNNKRTFTCQFAHDNFKLTLLTGDACEQLNILAASKTVIFDAWYLDGFAPSKNADMWSQKLFNVIYKLSKTGTTLSSFTAAGFVRRGLIESGFRIKKIPGLGKKREILTGFYPLNIA